MAYLPKQITCDSCLETIEFELEDIFSKKNQLSGDYEYYISCPLCNNEINVLYMTSYGIDKRDIQNDEI